MGLPKRHLSTLSLPVGELYAGGAKASLRFLERGLVSRCHSPHVDRRAETVCKDAEGGCLHAVVAVDADDLDLVGPHVAQRPQQAGIRECVGAFLVKQ